MNLCFYNLNCSMENNNEIDEGNARFSRSNFRQIETNLFAPYKALGLICSSVPPTFMPSPPKSGKDGYICCALDIQVTGFTVSPLRLAFGMAPLESEITLLAADTHRIYAAFSNFVAVIKNRKLEYRLPIPNGGAKLLLSLTESIVVVDKGNGMNVFNVRDGQLIVQLDSPASFQITALVHPHTYLNKILVGAADGRMRLWNLRSGKLVHEFPADEDFCSAVRVLEQSTAIDVVGAGMEDGQIHLRNIKVDKILCTFRQTGKITALAFRTDGVDTLASANSEGTIAIWDLNGGQLLCQLPEAHKASSITFLHFLLGQPIMLSAGGDNKIVKWFCRNENSAPEVNNILEGHSEPATSVKFCDDLIISTSQDGHVRQFLTKRTHRVKDFGLAREVRRGNLSKDRFIDVPLGPITQMEMSRGMEAVWDNLICSHEESPLISTWSTRYMRRGVHLLYHDRFANRPELLTAFVSALFVSNCGNFALAGYSSGHVDVFNMQSGKYKFSLEDRWTTAALKEPQQSTRKKKKSDDRAHESLVSGIALDLLNRNAVTGAADGKIHFWEFGQSPKLRTKMRVNSGVRLFRLDLFNSLLAVGLESGEVGVVDILCRRLARQLAHYNYIDWTEQAHLTALEFSGDGKWLLSADNQGFIKVWNLASGMLIDVMHCLRPCIGMAFSERSDFLATLHDGQRGIYLWANKRLFMTESPIVSRTVDELHQNAAAPTPLPNFVQQLNELQNKEMDNDKEGALEESVHSERIVRIDEDEDDDDEQPSSCRGDAEMMDLERESAEAGPSSASMHSSFAAEKEQLDCRLFTLSGLALSRWAGLPILDQIRQRNRPKEPPKKAKAAPFFLPTMDTPEGFQFDRGAMEKLREEGNNGNGGRPIAMAIRRLGPGETLQEKWQNALMRAKSKAEHCELFAQLKEMSLSALDFQIRSLNGSSELAQFLAMLATISETRREFDLVQSYLATFLNIHHERLWNGEERKREEGMEEEEEQNENGQKALTENLERILAFQKQTMEEIQPLFDRALHLAEFTKSVLI